VKDLEKDKLLLKLEWILLILGCIIFFSTAIFVEYLDIPENAKLIAIVISFLPFIFVTYYAIKIEQVAGFYECPNCHNKYIPTYREILFSPHFGRTRRLECPKCGEKHWNKKVLE